MMKLDIFGDAACLHISVASLMTSTKIADFRSGTVISVNLGYVTTPSSVSEWATGVRRLKEVQKGIQKVREVSLTHLTTFFASHRTCVRFQ